MNEFLRALSKAQGNKTLVQFARDLGLSHSYLSLIYSGHRGVGKKAIAAFLNYPDTRDATLLFLSQKVTLDTIAVSTDTVPIATEA